PEPICSPSPRRERGPGGEEPQRGRLHMPIGQILVNWLLIGSFYAAVALGFSLVWGIMNIVNLAHGALLILGAYVAYFTFYSLHLNPLIGILAAMLALFVVGWLIQYVAIN